MYENSVDDDGSKNISKLFPKVIQRILELHEDKRKPPEIVWILRGYENIPNAQQSKNSLIKTEIKKHKSVHRTHGENPLTMRDLFKFYEDHKAIPDDD